jgi:ABC-type lipoprotein release transport system permease subunit
MGVTMTVAMISLLAGYIPARRAAEVDPTLALHAE